MKVLRDRIAREGRNLGHGILKVSWPSLSRDEERDQLEAVHVQQASIGQL